MSEQRLTNEPNMEIYSCPLCEWKHMEKRPDVSAATLASVFGTGVMAAVADQQKAWRVEKALDDHFATHSTVEWLRKVSSQEGEIKRLREYEWKYKELCK